MATFVVESLCCVRAGGYGHTHAFSHLAKHEYGVSTSTNIFKLRNFSRNVKSYNLKQKKNPSLNHSTASSNSASGSSFVLDHHTDFTQQGLAAEYTSLHHVGFLCKNLELSLDFYCGILGLQVNNDRPADKLPYRGAWLWVGSGMIHLMELPNPDPVVGRPSHGGRDRHTCVAIKDVNKLREVLGRAGVSYTLSKSGRPAIFTRDPDGNALELAQFD